MLNSQDESASPQKESPTDKVATGLHGLLDDKEIITKKFVMDNLGEKGRATHQPFYLIDQNGSLVQSNMKVIGEEVVIDRTAPLQEEEREDLAAKN